MKAAGVSRGSLLHHFPSLRHLLEALVGHLVARNDRIAGEALRDLPEGLDPVSRAVQALYATLARPAFQAELELWAAARTDTVFGEEVTRRPGSPLIAEHTIKLTRGLAISGPLHSGSHSDSRLIE